MKPVNGADALIVIAGFGLFMIVFWPLTLARAISHIMTNAFFGAERPLNCSEYRRFLLSTMLMMAAMALTLVILSPTGRHPHIEYHQPIGIMRLILASSFAGLALGVGTWALFRLQMKRLAKFHHPTLATWSGIGFWGPKKRKMEPEERIAFLRHMNASDYLEYVRFVVLFFLLLPFLILAVSIQLEAPAKGFIPVFKQFAHDLVGTEIVLAILGFTVATVLWLLGRFFVWIGWSRTYA